MTVNGAYAPKNAPALQRLAEIANQIVCDYLRKNELPVRWAPGRHDFIEKFSPILQTALLTVELDTLARFDTEEKRLQRMREIVLELER